MNLKHISTLAVLSIAAPVLQVASAHSGRAHRTTEPQISNWSKIKQESLGPGLFRQYIHGEKAMFVRFDFKKGSTVPLHSHPNEQITFVEKGHMDFTVGDKKHQLKNGDLLLVPPNVIHGAKVLEDTIEYDVFAPPRLDWITKQDSYLTGKAISTLKSPYKTLRTWKGKGNDIEVVAKLTFRPGNLAILPDGRIIFSVHPLGGNSDFKVLELLPNGTTQPFPNKQYAAKANAETGIGFDAVIGIESDPYGNLYMLDKGGVDGRPAKLVVWDTRNDKLLHSIAIPAPIMRANSFIQDLAIDTKRGKVYLADMSRGDLLGKSDPAIITVDLATGQSRRALANHTSLQPSKDHPFVIDGQELAIKDEKAAFHGIYLGLNPITIDPKNEWVYYGSMNSNQLYRIPAAALADTSLTPKQIQDKIETAGKKPVGDGVTAGADGKIYTTAVNKNAIHYTDKNGKDVLLANSPNLSWPDGLTIGSDKMIYATVNQLGRLAPLNKNTDRTKAGEFYIIRTKPAGDVVIGR